MNSAFAELLIGLPPSLFLTSVHRQILWTRAIRKGKCVPACPRRPVAEILDIPKIFFEYLEENQKISSCCRHPENHDIEALYSSENWKNKQTDDGYFEPWGGVPDIYIFHCTCGRKHPRFMVGRGDFRPMWGVQSITNN